MSRLYLVLTGDRRTSLCVVTVRGAADTSGTSDGQDQPKGQTPSERPPPT